MFRVREYLYRVWMYFKNKMHFYKLTSEGNLIANDISGLKKSTVLEGRFFLKLIDYNGSELMLYEKKC